MLRTRLLTATVLMPIIAFLVITGGWAYAIGVATMLTIGGTEYVSVMRKGGLKPYRIVFLTFILMAVLLQALGIMPQALAPLLAAFLIVCMTAMVAAYGDGDHLPAVNFGVTVGGALYIGWLGVHLLGLRQLPDGVYWSLVVISTVAAADTGAYVFGHWIGQHRMAPLVSPNKTWEGYLGGALVAALTGAATSAAAYLVAPHVHVVDGTMIGLLVGLVSPVGDLGMSALKRMVGEKDFGNILPGHGGILDRIDSVLVGATIGFYYIVWFALTR